MSSRTATAVRRRQGRREDGAVAVEFALIFPLLAIMVFGIMQYGIYFFSMQAGSSAARDAARRASVGDMPTCTSGTDPFVPYVKSRVGNAAFGNTITVKRSYAKASGNTGSGVEIGDIVTVQVAFDSLNLHLPFITVLGNTTVGVKADTRVEFVPTQPETCS